MRPYPLAVLLAAAGLLASAAPGFAVEASLHPFCVQQLLRLDTGHVEAETDRPIPATSCNQRYQKAPIEIRGDYYFAEMKPIKDRQPPYYKYRVVGYHRNATIVDVAESAGGNSVFSALAFFQGWPVSESRDNRDVGSNVTLIGTLEGGDRCNGGIADAKMTSPSTLHLSRNLTPYDLFLFRPVGALQREKTRVFYAAVNNEEIEPISDRLIALEPDRDLDTAPTSCIGAATTELDLDFGTAKLVSVTLTGLVDKNPEWVVKYKHQACFNRVVKSAVPSFPHTLSPEEFRDMSAAFETKCLAPSSP